MKLYLTEAPSNRLLAIKTVRESMRLLDPEYTAADAENTLGALAEFGYALLAEADFTQLSAVSESLEAGGCAAVVDPTPEWLEHRTRRIAAQADKREGLTPEQVFARRAPGARGEPKPEAPSGFSPEAYETALVVLATCNGNPLAAACHASNLGRATRSEGFKEVQRVLLRTHPWIEEGLLNAGMHPDA